VVTAAQYVLESVSHSSLRRRVPIFDYDSSNFGLADALRVLYVCYNGLHVIAAGE
jgi:hypothetical protein